MASAKKSTTGRHRKPRPNAAAHAMYPIVQVGTDNSVTAGTRTAITAALAVGVLAVSGGVAGGLDTPSASGSGGLGDSRTAGIAAPALTASAPALTASATSLGEGGDAAPGPLAVLGVLLRPGR